VNISQDFPGGNDYRITQLIKSILHTDIKTHVLLNTVQKF